MDSAIPTNKPKIRKFTTGAVRSTDADGVRFDLITPIGLRRLAETYAEGAKKYGEYNWLKGFPASDLMNHTIAHCYKFLSGDKSEDHLAHAAWGLLTIIHFQETRPELIDIPAIKNEQNINLEERFIAESFYGAHLNFTKDQVTKYEGNENIWISGIHYVLNINDVPNFKEWYGWRK